MFRGQSNDLFYSVWTAPCGSIRAVIATQRFFQQLRPLQTRNPIVAITISALDDAVRGRRVSGAAAYRDFRGITLRSLVIAHSRLQNDLPRMTYHRM